MGDSRDDEMGARGACDTGAPADVRLEQQNTSTNIENLAVPQRITGYTHDKHLLVVAVYRSGARHD